MSAPLRCDWCRQIDGGPFYKITGDPTSRELMCDRCAKEKGLELPPSTGFTFRMGPDGEGASTIDAIQGLQAIVGVIRDTPGVDEGVRIIDESYRLRALIASTLNREWAALRENEGEPPHAKLARQAVHLTMMALLAATCVEIDRAIVLFTKKIIDSHYRVVTTDP